MSGLARYQKMIAAFVTGAIGWGGVVVASAPKAITASEWLGLAVVAATALGVAAVPNAPKAPDQPPERPVPVADVVPAE